VNSNLIIFTNIVGPHSTHTVCPSCGNEINTKTTTQPGLMAYISGFIIALCGWVMLEDSSEWHTSRRELCSIVISSESS